MLFAETSALVSMGDDSNPHNIRKLFEQIAAKLPKNTSAGGEEKDAAFPISYKKPKKTTCC